MRERTLVADIGGTNARFAIYSGAPNKLDMIREYRVADFATIEDAATAYLDTIAQKPRSACFAVAAPVGGDEIAFTNSHWRFRPDDLKSALGLARFTAVNDFYALAAGAADFPDNYFAPVKAGAGDAAAPILVVGPGTGFGVSLIVPFENSRRIVSTQGGHVAFAPQTADECEIHSRLAQLYGRVSIERLLSGSGIVDIHRALCSKLKLRSDISSAAEISAASLRGADEIAVKTMNIFFAILGRAVGDGVLTTGARGGVILGGGILPKIRSQLLKSAFVDNFLDKGRMRDYVEPVPIRLIVRSDAALIGAAAAMEDE
ncbi:MAG: glucokinase [Parvularculaceae bacterium]|nr:glucokinase [Parvularculaceae bacterium]